MGDEIDTKILLADAVVQRIARDRVPGGRAHKSPKPQDEIAEVAGKGFDWVRQPSFAEIARGLVVIAKDHDGLVRQRDVSPARLGGIGRIRGGEVLAVYVDVGITLVAAIHPGWRPRPH